MKTEIDFDKFITEGLKQEPAFFLPTDFAERLAEKAGRKHAWQTNLQEYSWYAALVIGLVLVLFITCYLVNKEGFMQLMSFLNKNMVHFIAIVFIANFILFADKVILRMLFSMKK